ncbi:hypothetical protein SteCoe_27040 [Stentor coeruleus]|uniref:Uncharacterized protein n=1 Tax=Stentor coeruleus TaxID=5963 RepID=A0A1R2BBY4_9CILI|nr:hypothetical protein SteCoe_27040 [Stentor coeruleus]
MEPENKHRELILEYIKKSNLEIIVQNSIRSLIQSNAFPDNPFGAMFRHFTYFAAKDDLNRIQQKLKGTELKVLEPPGAFAVTNQNNELECFGLAHLLHYTNVNHFKVLTKTLKELCLEHKRTYKDYTLEVRVAVGGGEIFKSQLIPHPEVAPTPMQVRAECIVEGPKFENAFTLFADYVYEDIMRIGSNNALNLVRDFCIEQGPKSTYVKKVTLEQMQENKQLLINELKNATIQKRVSYVRVLVFSQDLERYSTKDLIRAVTPSRLLSVTEPSVLDHFQYISMKKSYILHYTTTGNPTDFSSLSPIPCLALYSSLFPNPDSARHYAKIFYTETQNPYEIPAIEEYLQLKRDRFIRYFNSGKIIKMIWETLEMALCSKDHASNAAVLNEIFSLLSHSSCKLYRVVKMSRALIVLINTFYDTGFDHFKKLAEGLFVRLKEEVWSAFGNASCPEIILLKPQIIRMLDATSVNKSRTLLITPNTLKIIEKLESICATIAKNSSELLLRHLPILTDTHLKLLATYNIQPGMTYIQLTESKQTELAFDLDQELKAQNLRNDNEYLVIYEYIIKTGIIELLILTTRDLVLSYPLIPNPLKIFAYKILISLFKRDMFKITSQEVLEQHMHVPNQVGQDIYVHSNPENMFNFPELPYIAGFEEILLICSWQEIGFFSTVFKGYELNVNLFQDSIPKGYNAQSIFSVCATSLLNSECLLKFPSVWQIYNDVFITGPSFNASSHAFLDLIVKYALWLDSATDVTVIGFFTPYSDIPLASFADLLTSTERKSSIGLILSAFQMNSRVWLKFIIPYKGNDTYGVTGIPLGVHVYFNMHFRVNMTKQVTSLVPLNSLEDIAKVFYSREDFELWKEIIDIRSQTTKEKLANEMNVAYSTGQHYRGMICLMIIKVLEKDKDVIGQLLRVNETPLKSITEASRFAEVAYQLMLMASNNNRKADIEQIKDWSNKLTKYVEAVFLQERNVILESTQVNIIRVSNRLYSAVSNANGPKYHKALAAVKEMSKHLKVAELIASLAVYDFIQEKDKLAS